MNSKILISGVLFASLLVAGPLVAQDGSADATGDVVATAQGETDIANALAAAMVSSGASADTAAALTTIEGLRAEGMGWGEIAQELGFNLGEVVSAAARAGLMGNGAGAAGLAIAEENRNRGDAEGDAGAEAGANAGAATAASARVQADVGKAIAADARANARIDAGARGSVSGRPAGVGAPVLPQRVERPARPERPRGR